MPECQCPLSEYCTVRGVKLHGRLWAMCHEGKSSEVDAILARAQRKPSQAASRGLGDTVSQALSAVGITEERVQAWIGKECGCPERREKLNKLGEWASKTVSGALTNAKQHLVALFSQS